MIDCVNNMLVVSGVSKSCVDYSLPKGHHVSQFLCACTARSLVQYTGHLCSQIEDVTASRYKTLTLHINATVEEAVVFMACNETAFAKATVLCNLDQE